MCDSVTNHDCHERCEAERVRDGVTHTWRVSRHVTVAGPLQRTRTAGSETTMDIASPALEVDVVESHQTTRPVHAEVL